MAQVPLLRRLLSTQAILDVKGVAVVTHAGHSLASGGALAPVLPRERRRREDAGQRSSRCVKAVVVVAAGAYAASSSTRRGNERRSRRQNGRRPGGQDNYDDFDMAWQQSDRSPPTARHLRQDARAARSARYDEEDEFENDAKNNRPAPRHTLVHSIDLLSSKLKIPPGSARRIAEVLQGRTVRLEGEDPTGTKTKRWARRLVRGLNSHPLLRAMCLSGKDGVISALEELERRSTRHGEKVSAIERQHRAVREDEEGDLKAYSEASAYMGQAWWLRTVHDRIAQLIDEYYLLTPEQVRRGHPPWAFKRGGLLPQGWKKYKVKDRVLYWNPRTKRMQTEAPPLPDAPEGCPVQGEPEPRMPPVQLLDIGSCTDPFSRFPYLVESSAIDLLPADAAAAAGGRVLQADFFEVPIASRSSGKQASSSSSSSSSPSAADDGIQRMLLDADGKLDGIVEGSFDVVVLSLVLSYVDSADRRLEMVAKARRCLRDDRGLLFIAEVGSALADVSWYNGDAAMDWSRSIEQLGFRIVRFDDMVKEKYPYRAQKVNQWIFETAPIPARDSSMPPIEPLKTPKEMPWTR